jgi:hypothetical protein
LYCRGSYISSPPLLLGFKPGGFNLKIAVNKVALEQVLYDSLPPFYHHSTITLYSSTCCHIRCVITLRRQHFITLWSQGSIHNVPQILTCYKFLLKIHSVILPLKRMFVKFLYLQTSFHIPYILQSNPHPFYSFRGLKNQMRITIACGLDSRLRAGFWKNDGAAVSAVSTIQ